MSSFLFSNAPSYDYFSICPFIKSFAIYTPRQKGATTDTTGGVPLFAVKIFLQVSTILWLQATVVSEINVLF